MDDTYENAFQLAATSRDVPGSSLNDTTIPVISDMSHISTDGASEPVIPLATTKFKTPLPAIPSNIQSRDHVSSNTYTTAMEQNARFRGVNPCQSNSERPEYDTAVSDHVVAGKGKNTPPGNKSRIVVYILLGLSIALSIVVLILFFVIGQQENEEIKAMKGIIESLQTNLTAQTSEIKIMKLNVDAQASEIKNANALINILQSNTAVLSTGIDNNDKDIERLEANFTAQASDVQTIAGQFLRSVVLLAEGIPVTNLRLAGNGSNSMRGRVEVYKAGIWGTVCDDSWDINDGNVVCRQLGFFRAIIVTSNANVFGQGSGPIWMDDIACSGSESSIWACSYSEIHNCDHSEDAGVYCTFSFS